ncbi:predicted protein [Histoplasma capsulatum var. duboisii H88]|uniref:Predicted protein n=1 Tax=Ajellomyces capsulatus (strain H88) TaxID=544711 RepID=F0UGG5_AJEC8|nr:predicted protein [Histoplasma capsulatum var. duboisii H88]
MLCTYHIQVVMLFGCVAGMSTAFGHLAGHVTAGNFLNPRVSCDMKTEAKTLILLLRGNTAVKNRNSLVGCLFQPLPHRRRYRRIDRRVTLDPFVAHLALGLRMPKREDVSNKPDAVKFLDVNMSFVGFSQNSVFEKFCRGRPIVLSQSELWLGTHRNHFSTSWEPEFLSQPNMWQRSKEKSKWTLTKEVRDQRSVHVNLHSPVFNNAGQPERQRLVEFAKAALGEEFGNWSTNKIGQKWGV